MDIEMIKLVFGIVGTIAFAVSGALIAIENKLDLFGVIILAIVTASGGGLFRDIMIGKSIAMFESYYYPAISFITAVIVFMIMSLIRNLKWEESKTYKIFYNITDSLGLGTFVIVGASIAYDCGINDLFPVAFYGVLTACGGGMLRDILVCKIPAIFRKHIYAVAAIIGALLFYFMNKANVWYPVSGSITILSVVAIRYLAFHFELNLPKVKLNTDI